MSLNFRWGRIYCLTDVDVRDDIILDPVRKVFTPFGTTNKAILKKLGSVRDYKIHIGARKIYLFSIPASDDDIPEWSPSRLVQCTETVNDLSKADSSRRRVCGAHNPSYKPMKQLS